MVFSINDLRAQLTFGGAKPTLFQVLIQNPVNAAADLKVPFMVKAATLPESDLGVVTVPYMGRKIHSVGDRTFQPWSVTVINDEDFIVRNSMEAWMAAMNSHEGNITSFSTGAPLQYKTQAQIIQYSKTGVPIREYTFHGLFPTQLSAIDMSWENTDTIEEFQVTFQYDYWSVSGGITGNAGTNV
jgi:hypothetical protein